MDGRKRVQEKREEGDGKRKILDDPFELLSDEVMLEILWQTDVKTLGRLSVVSKRMRVLATDPMFLLCVYQSSELDIQTLAQVLRRAFVSGHIVKVFDFANAQQKKGSNLAQYQRDFIVHNLFSTIAGVHVDRQVLQSFLLYRDGSAKPPYALYERCTPRCLALVWNVLKKCKTFGASLTDYEVQASEAWDDDFFVFRDKEQAYVVEYPMVINMSYVGYIAHLLCTNDNALMLEDMLEIIREDNPSSLSGIDFAFIFGKLPVTCVQEYYPRCFDVLTRLDVGCNYGYSMILNVPPSPQSFTTGLVQKSIDLGLGNPFDSYVFHYCIGIFPVQEEFLVQDSACLVNAILSNNLELFKFYLEWRRKDDGKMLNLYNTLNPDVAKRTCASLQVLFELYISDRMIKSGVLDQKSGDQKSGDQDLHSDRILEFVSLLFSDHSRLPAIVIMNTLKSMNPFFAQVRRLIDPIGLGYDRVPIHNKQEATFHILVFLKFIVDFLDVQEYEHPFNGIIRSPLVTLDALLHHLQTV